jgi:hypothetical protein
MSIIILLLCPVPHEKECMISHIFEVYHPKGHKKATKYPGMMQRLRQDIYFVENHDSRSLFLLHLSVLSYCLLRDNETK